jgi:hypothetical protein
MTTNGTLASRDLCEICHQPLAGHSCPNTSPVVVGAFSERLGRMIGNTGSVKTGARHKERCPHCGGPGHFNYPAKLIKHECLWRQYEADMLAQAHGEYIQEGGDSTLPRPSQTIEYAPETVIDYAEWYAANPDRAYATTKTRKQQRKERDGVGVTVTVVDHAQRVMNGQAQRPLLALVGAEVVEVGSADEAGADTPDDGTAHDPDAVSAEVQGVPAAEEAGDGATDIAEGDYRELDEGEMPPAAWQEAVNDMAEEGAFEEVDPPPAPRKRGRKARVSDLDLGLMELAHEDRYGSYDYAA